MNSNIEYKNRLMIPRMNPFIVATLMGETKGLAKTYSPTQQDLSYHKKKLVDWLNNNTSLHALDFVASALLLDKTNASETRKAIGYLEQQYSKLSYTGQYLIDHITNKKPLNENEYIDTRVVEYCKRLYHCEIARLKRQLASYIYDPITWLDLTFFYTVLGQYEKGRKCIMTALHLNSINRFVLRSAARFFLHIDEPDRSLDLLRKAVTTNEDPWLISAEIAMSEITSSKSRFVKSGIGIVRAEQIHPFNTTELNASLATLEFTHGKIKKAKKFIKTALVSPNENTLAQAEYLSRNIYLRVNSGIYDVPFNYEARMWEDLRSGQFKEAQGNAIKWMKYQPFSSKPVILSTYISSVALLDDKSAIAIVENTCPSMQKDPMVANNYAFALANSGQVEKAKRVLQTLDTTNISAHNEAVLNATHGLIEFRSGKIEQGRELYKKAITFFDGKNDKRALCRAYLFLGREELRNGNVNGIRHVKKATRFAEAFALPEITAYCNCLLTTYGKSDNSAK